MKKFKSLCFFLCFAFIFTLTNIMLPSNTVKAMAASKSYWIFDFGSDSSSVGNNYTKVTPNTLYDPSTGYGFEETSGLQAVDRGAPDYIREDFITSNKKATFKADVPNGRYTVRIISGDNESATTLKKVKAENITAITNAKTKAGEFIEKLFTVNVCDNQLTLNFSSDLIHINAIEINSAANTSTPTVYIAGDSTVMSYKDSYAPQQGWGKSISQYFNTNNINFINKAIGGRSSKSFAVQGRLDEIISMLHPKDYLFIQMGHNDSDSSHPDRYTNIDTYKMYLKKYIDGAHAKGATPILITPVARLHYSDGKFINDFPTYCNAMKEVAKKTNTKCIDLMSKSLACWTSLGYDSVYPFYLVSSNGTDYTHFTEAGANKVAGLITQGIKELKLPISKYLKEDIQ
ncbi:GDSL-type esterase/lipase family protein [Clostridium sp. SHJSY1]|uniref:rhamnogalacturonan acetylesterase n=1 Tax=Clostridium sp. SHJSY1 TaxID=2942483 RepID=UPI002875B205|nr:SGNH/GDSL hydrolase family protein [Clostridium sp. SHJSY1]MDS0525867.1 GDSL-type esterase/lipase family protein [Clostridium sp. SHJSY1]